MIELHSPHKNREASHQIWHWQKIGGLIIIKFGQFLKKGKTLEYFWEKNMKILELVKNLFRYPVDMEEKIIQHEEKMLKVYTQIIDES